MDGGDLVNRLDLNHQPRVDQKVYAIGGFEAQTVIFYVDRSLTFDVISHS